MADKTGVQCLMESSESAKPSKYIGELAGEVTRMADFLEKNMRVSLAGRLHAASWILQEVERLLFTEDL